MCLLGSIGGEFVQTMMRYPAMRAPELVTVPFLFIIGMLVLLIAFLGFAPSVTRFFEVHAEPPPALVEPEFRPAISLFEEFSFD